MRYPTKVALVLVLASALPVAASGLVTAGLSGRALDAEMDRLQTALAVQTAAAAGGWFRTAADDLRRVASYLPFEQLQGAELATALRLPLRQLAYVNAVALLDRKGRAVVPPAYLPEGVPIDAPDLKGRRRMREADLARLAAHVPVELALSVGVAFGPAYRGSGGDGRVVCAVRVDLPRRGESWVLAAELSLDEVEQVLGRATAGGRTAYLLDPTSRVVLAAPRSAWNAGAAALPDDAPRGASRSGHVRRSDGREVLASHAPVGTVGYRLALELPLQSLAANRRALLGATWVWTGVCLLFALAGGLYLGRGVARPVGELARAARRVESGDYEARVPVASRDEVGQLASAFNQMAQAIRESMGTITAQKDELAAWNAELKTRVEERTREVREAIDQVIQSQKLGAVGELGAGLAHELNNPMTIISGLSQMLLASAAPTDPNREAYEGMIQAADRTAEIVRNLQRFSETPMGLELQRLDVARLVRETLALTAARLAESKVELRLEVGPALPEVRGNAAELSQVLLHLVQNAVRAMPKGGQLAVGVHAVEEAVAIRVLDTGRGISPTDLGRIFEPFYAPEKTRTGRPGLGLSVAKRIVDEHQGRIVVRSTVGQGTEFTVFLPGLRGQTHLS